MVGRGPLADLPGGRRGRRDGDEALHRFEQRLERLLPECDGRLLAMRVEFHGATAAHTALAAKSPHWTQEVRRAALDGGSGRIWVEKVVFKTTPPAAPAPAGATRPWPSWPRASTSSGATTNGSAPWATARSKT